MIRRDMGGHAYDMRKRRFGDAPVDLIAKKLMESFPGYEVVVMNTLLRAAGRHENRHTMLCWSAVLEHKVDKTQRVVGSYDTLSHCLYRGYTIKTQHGFDVEILVYANPKEEVS